MHKLTSMERAAKEFFIGGYDPVGQHKTPNDLAFSMLHEIDLYEEGEPNELDTPAKVGKAKAFVRRWSGVVTLLVVMMSTAAFGQTKACQIAKDAAGKQLAGAPALVKELDVFTDADRPTVERALTAFLNAANAEITETCDETDEDRAADTLTVTAHNAKTALVHYANVRSAAHRKEAQ